MIWAGPGWRGPDIRPGLDNMSWNVMGGHGRSWKVKECHGRS